jgi:hypothetical protein
MCASKFLSEYSVFCQIWLAETHGRLLSIKQSFRTERVTAVAQTTAPVAEKSHSWPCSMRPRARIVPSVCAICRFANAWMTGNHLNIQQFTELAAAARHQSHKLPPWLGSTASVDRALAQRLQPPVHLPGPFQIGWPGETDVSWTGLGFILHIAGAQGPSRLLSGLQLPG